MSVVSSVLDLDILKIHIKSDLSVERITELSLKLKCFESVAHSRQNSVCFRAGAMGGKGGGHPSPNCASAFCAMPKNSTVFWPQRANCSLQRLYGVERGLISHCAE